MRSRFSTNLIRAMVLLLSVVHLAIAQQHSETDEKLGISKSEAKASRMKSQNSYSDREMSMQIRKSIAADKSLSTYGHNVKVIVQHGGVTLRGRVLSDEEKASVEDKAEALAGDGKVDNKVVVMQHPETPVETKPKPKPQ